MAFEPGLSFLIDTSSIVRASILEDVANSVRSILLSIEPLDFLRKRLSIETREKHYYYYFTYPRQHGVVLVVTADQFCLFSFYPGQANLSLESH